MGAFRANAIYRLRGEPTPFNLSTKGEADMKDFYNQYRNLLFALAYQLTGSVEDAEDAVHDVFVKASDIQLNQLEEPKAYLCKW